MRYRKVDGLHSFTFFTRLTIYVQHDHLMNDLQDGKFDFCSFDHQNFDCPAYSRRNQVTKWIVETRLVFSTFKTSCC